MIFEKSGEKILFFIGKKKLLAKMASFMGNVSLQETSVFFKVVPKHVARILEDPSKNFSFMLKPEPIAGRCFVKKMGFLLC